MLKQTGFLEREQKDINPNSPTYNQTRWVADATPSPDCPADSTATYQSAAIVEYVSRNNCPAGYFGGTIQYSLPAGVFTSTISQGQADQLAREYFDSTKQQYANANAGCSL